MENYREEQLEALKAVNEYSKRLVVAVENVSNELSGNRMADTDKYLDEVIKGINWIIEIVNRTMDVINENEILVDKVKVNAVIKELGSALNKKDDALIAASLKGGVLEFVKTVEKATAEY